MPFAASWQCRLLGCALLVTLATSAAAQPMSQEPLSSQKEKEMGARGAGLRPELWKQFGELLERDWQPRPEWAEMAIAISKGSPIRMGTGWYRPAEKRYDWAWLQDRFDADQNGQIERAEVSVPVENLDELYGQLDQNEDGKWTEADFRENTSDSASENPQRRMAGLLFTLLDKDSNGRVTVEELNRFFVESDRELAGFLTPEDLLMSVELAGLGPTPGAGGPPSPAQMLELLLTGQLGVLEPGPALNDIAPDFTLSTYDGQSTVTLSEQRGNKPVVLIFGSFT